MELTHHNSFSGRMEYVSPEGLRLDGRRPKEIRQIKAELSVLKSADGSATFEMGNTKVRLCIHLTAFASVVTHHDWLFSALCRLWQLYLVPRK